MGLGKGGGSSDGKIGKGQKIGPPASAAATLWTGPKRVQWRTRMRMAKSRGKW